MRIALGLEYDGAPFCGWQHQPAGCGVQDHVERALSAFAASPVQTVAAGRTDAGVHARAQVLHFDTEAARPDGAWVRGVNAHLPESVAVLWAARVADDFHARYAALALGGDTVTATRTQRSASNKNRGSDQSHRCMVVNHGPASNASRTSSANGLAAIERVASSTVTKTHTAFSQRAAAYGSAPVEPRTAAKASGTAGVKCDSGARGATVSHPVSGTSRVPRSATPSAAATYTTLSNDTPSP